MANAAHAQGAGYEKNSVVVAGIAEVAYDPDYLIVNLQNRESQKSGTDRNETARKERALIETLKGLGIDTNLLAVHRFSVSESSSIFRVGKFGVEKTYSLRIDDPAHYEEIILAVSKVGFDHSWISRLGINDQARKEAEVMTAALNSGKAKAIILQAALSDRKQLKLSGMEEMQNNFRIDEDSRRGSGTRDQGLSIGGGSYSMPVNLSLDKVIIRKAFLMKYTIWPGAPDMPE